MPVDRPRNHPPMEGPAPGAQAAAPVGGDPAGCGPEHGLRAGTRGTGDDSRDTRPDQATRYLETALGILSYAELAPLLAERVTQLEAAVLAEEFATRPPDESLITEFHARICGDLTPDWAEKWRVVEVAVGPLTPPSPHQLPMLMRDYGLDLQARWADASGDDIALALEFLAFAEGRFLTIHPFRDFNGRPSASSSSNSSSVSTSPASNSRRRSDAGRTQYFDALAAADRRDWQPLIAIWKARFISTQTVQ